MSDKDRKQRARLRDAFTKARNQAQAAANNGKLSADKVKKLNDALNAYGAEGEKNGVTVGVGTVKGEAGSTLPTFAINEKWNGVATKYLSFCRDGDSHTQVRSIVSPL